MLAELRNKIKNIMLGEIKEIVLNTKKGNMIVVEEKADGDSATNADIKIGQIFLKKLKELLPGSVVINEEDFNEDVYKKMKISKYIWVVDPIDGTKAFRTPGNDEYCIGVLLFENKNNTLNPILSVVYAPEYQIGENKEIIFEAIETEKGIKLNGCKIDADSDISIQNIKCVNHINRDTKLNENERTISNMCKESEIIRAYEGHSTLINYALVASDRLQRVFTRRNPYIWDVVQGAYLVEKAGGEVYYPDGRNVFPIKEQDLTFNGNKLIMKSNIASAESVKCEILDKIKN